MSYNKKVVLVYIIAYTYIMFIKTLYRKQYEKLLLTQLSKIKMSKIKNGG